MSDGDRMWLAGLLAGLFGFMLGAALNMSGETRNAKEECNTVGVTRIGKELYRCERFQLSEEGK